jgi:hypothetical protein
MSAIIGLLVNLVMSYPTLPVSETSDIFLLQQSYVLAAIDL